MKRGGARRDLVVLPEEEARAVRGRIRELRKARGWSMQALAAGAGTSKSTVWLAEGGRDGHALTMDAVEAFAGAFGMSTAELLSGGAA